MITDALIAQVAAKLGWILDEEIPAYFSAEQDVEMAAHQPWRTRTSLMSFTADGIVAMLEWALSLGDVDLGKGIGSCYWLKFPFRPGINADSLAEALALAIVETP